LAWRVEFADSAAKQLRKLDQPIALRITRFLRERVASAKDPRALGTALRGDEFGRFWKYRVGDYRIIGEIQDREVRVLIVRLGHRREVYR